MEVFMAWIFPQNNTHLTDENKRFFLEKGLGALAGAGEEESVSAVANKNTQDK